jgi:hypothetical protein
VHHRLGRHSPYFAGSRAVRPASARRRLLLFASARSRTSDLGHQRAG